MNQASVGFQCPHCVADGAKSVRSPRTAAGGLLPKQVGRVTMIIIGINLAVFVATYLTGRSSSEVFLQGAMLSESAIGPNGDVLTGFAQGAWWRPLTSAFLHENILHILFNMYALYIFGPMLEQLLGVRRFVAMYVTTAIGASALVYVLSTPLGLTIGASGAVFGLFAVALIMLIHRGQDVRFLLVLLAINAVLSLQGGISWQGHLGGFVTGAVLGLAFAYAPRDKRIVLQAGAFAVVWLAIIAAFALRTAQLTL